ncbi:MAG: UDP-N-acetylmuramate dehydrogenase [bacterium]|nr:UDP-N-acetylmuramate dehydrogenase [bacterium]
MFDSKIQQNIPLAPLTTFKIGGPAKYFVETETKEELAAAFDWARENKEPVFVLAGGSNVLINDKGADGLVVKICNSGIKVMGQRLDCGAGAGLMAAARMAINENLTGLEWAIGIPGTVGGAVRGNAGAYGKSISGAVETVTVFDAKKKKFFIFSNKDCRFNYKESVFKGDNGEQSRLIWQVIIKLENGNAAEIKELSEKYLKYREQTQPKLPSAGCVFKNLLIANLREFNATLANEALETGAGKDDKVGAGWLIDKLGLKGKTIGGAKISLEHANFIVNTGKATAEDVVALISFIKQQARDKFGVQLREEVEYLGF